MLRHFSLLVFMIINIDAYNTQCTCTRTLYNYRCTVYSGQEKKLVIRCCLNVDARLFAALGCNRRSSWADTGRSQFALGRLHRTHFGSTQMLRCVEGRPIRLRRLLRLPLRFPPRSRLPPRFLLPADAILPVK